MQGRSIVLNQTAHISLQCLQFSNNVETKRTDRAKLLPSATASICLYFASTPLRFRPAVSATVAIIAAGEGAFTHTTKNPQPLKYTFFIFFQKKNIACLFFHKVTHRFSELSTEFRVIFGNSHESGWNHPRNQVPESQAAKCC